MDHLPLRWVTCVPAPDHRIPSGQRITYEYGAHDLLTGIAYPNGLGQQVTHQHLGGLQEARLTNGFGHTLNQQRYRYNGQQRLVSREDVVAGQQHTFAYDAESRLLAVASPQTGQAKERFTYDAAGTLSNLNGWPVQTSPMGEIRAVGVDAWQYDQLGNVTQLRGPRGLMQLDFARNSTLSSLTVNGQRWQ